MCLIIHNTKHSCGHDIQTFDFYLEPDICLFGEYCVQVGHCQVSQQESDTPCYECEIKAKTGHTRYVVIDKDTKFPADHPLCSEVRMAQQVRNEAVFKQAQLTAAQKLSINEYCAGVLDGLLAGAGLGFLRCKELLEDILDTYPEFVDKRLLVRILAWNIRDRFTAGETGALEGVCDDNGRGEYFRMARRSDRSPLQGLDPGAARHNSVVL